MRLSYNWLKDYVDFKVKPERLAELLTMSGTEVTSVEKSGDDWVMELEVTPNRADCLSIVGLAREVAAVLGKDLKMPGPKVVGKFSNEPPLKIEIKDKDLCARYTGRIIQDVKVGPSPDWLAKKLVAMGGLRPVNNVVDITNFCLFELGQPLHAFDYNKLRGGKIIVRRPVKGEKIVTIDGVERELDKDILVIADAERPVAIAGVMGGLDTEVSASTKTILIESAYFDPVSIRRTSRRLGLSSESSYRFERKVDIEGVLACSNRAAELICKFGSGTAGKLADVGLKTWGRPKDIMIDPAAVNRILGVEDTSYRINTARLREIFQRLGMKTVMVGNKLKVQIPSFRPDISKEIDLAEEAARIHGYDKIPSTIPKIVGHTERKELSQIVKQIAREYLVASGLTEVITYSLVSEAMAAEKDRPVSIMNPLSAEQGLMRTSLIPSLLGAVAFNLNRKSEDIKIFEMGKSYKKLGSMKYEEKDRLAIALLGERYRDWRAEKKEVDFFDTKGAVEGLFKQLGIKNYDFIKAESSFLSDDAAAKIVIGQEAAGFVGRLASAEGQRFDIKREVYIAELDLEVIIKYSNLTKKYQPIPKFPSILRDVSMVISQGHSSGQIVSLIREIGRELSSCVELIDRYSGRQIPEGAKGLTYRIEYRHPDRTLTDEEVNALHERIRNALVEKLQVQLR